MQEVLLIGYGNPLRGDDGIGWRIAQWFEEHPCPTPIQILICHQLTPDLAEELSRVRLVVFVDAREDDQPGTVRCDPLYLQAMEPSSFIHHIDPTALLSYSQSLYGCSPQAYLVTVAGENFGYAETLSTTVENALPEAIDCVQNLVREFCS